MPNGVMDSARRGGAVGSGGSSPAAISSTASSASSSAPSSALEAASAAQTLPIEEHFDRIRANLIRCEECNENFFFDFLRHPRYFVAHFKACHLKNVLYRFNGLSEEENQRIRFGPRRKKDATAWFSQLKSTEKRMISMQDNKWSEIAEKECWVCRVCNDQKADLTHAYEPNDLGQRQALLHLRQTHVTAYDAFLRSLPEAPMSVGGAAAAASELATSVLARGNVKRLALPVYSSATSCVNTASTSETMLESSQTPAMSPRSVSISCRANGLRSSEAERSRLRRLRAPPEMREMEAQRSKKRREKMTPAQRHADYERRKRKKKRLEEAERSKKRRKEAPRELKEKETRRSRDRRLQATEDQREREAQRSRERRRKATEDQKARERERCRRRYEAKKLSIQQRRSVSATSDTADDGDLSLHERGGLAGEEASGHRSLPVASSRGVAAGSSHSINSIPTSSHVGASVAPPASLVAGGGANSAAPSRSALQSLYASLAEPPASASASSEPQA